MKELSSSEDRARVCLFSIAEVEDHHQRIFCEQRVHCLIAIIQRNQFDSPAKIAVSGSDAIPIVMKGVDRSAVELNTIA